jgi:hypothetical protein
MRELFDAEDTFLRAPVVSSPIVRQLKKCTRNGLLMYTRLLTNNVDLNGSRLPVEAQPPPAEALLHDDVSRRSHLCSRCVASDESQMVCTSSERHGLVHGSTIGDAHQFGTARPKFEPVNSAAHRGCGVHLHRRRDAGVFSGRTDVDAVAGGCRARACSVADDDQSVWRRD